MLTTMKFTPSYLFVLKLMWFCVCTFVEDDEGNGLHIEYICEYQRFWGKCVTKAECFFKTYLLPEILGNWYTRDSIGTIETQDGNSSGASGSVIET